MKSVLVTGGAGFIGSFLCERLLAQGHEVLCLDNFFTGRRANLTHLLDHPRFEVLRHDVVEPIQLETERIFHLACPASPVHYWFDPIKTIETCFLGTRNMLNVAWRTKSRLLIASTSEVYGDPLVHPQTETYFGNVNPIGMRSCYDEGKRAAETLTMDYHRQRQVDAKIVRIFNTYGPRMLANDGRVVSNFIVAALKNEPLTIYGDGQQTRAFCYVDDLVEGLLAMMEQDGFMGPVNLGHPGEMTILALAQQVKDLTGSRSEIRHLPAREDEPLQRDPDITLARNKLGWVPTVKLQEGLKKTVAYFEQTLNNT